MLVKNLKQTCGACPSQWEFRTDNNRPVYVRYRYGYLSVCVGDEDASLDSAVIADEIYGKQIGDDLDGFIGWDNVEKRISNIDMDAV